ACSGGCPIFPAMPFSVDDGGIVSYAPSLEGPFSGAGTNTLVVHSFTFLPAGDDISPSLGLFRVVVEPAFWNLMNGYPGYAVVNGLHRLISPTLYDQQTKIGRSSPHRHGDLTDGGGT